MLLLQWLELTSKTLRLPNLSMLSIYWWNLFDRSCETVREAQDNENANGQHSLSDEMAR